MKRFIRAVLALCVGFCCSTAVKAQIAIPNTTPVTEDFNTISNTNRTLPSNWEMTPSATSAAAAVFGGGSNVDTVTYTSASGSPSAGGRYGLGFNASYSDAAVGFMTSSGYAADNCIMAHFEKTNTNTLSSLSLSYSIEKYRTNSRACTVNVYYSTTGLASSWTMVGSASITPATGTSSYHFTVAGPTVSSVSGASITGLSVPNGGDIYLLWEFDQALNTNGMLLGLDDVSVTASFSSGSVPEVGGFTVAQVTNDRARLTWTKPGGTYSTDWSGVVVVARETSANDASFAAQNGDTYTEGGNSFGGGGTTNNNSRCVEVATTDANGDVTITGLTPGNTYYFKAYVYKDNGGSDAWSSGSSDISIVARPQNVTGLGGTIASGSVTLAWTNPAVSAGTWFDEVQVVARASSDITLVPSGSGYTATNTVFGVSPATDLNSPKEEYSVYKGTGSGVTVTGLTNGTTYYFKVFTRKGSDWSTGTEVNYTPNSVLYYSVGDNNITSSSSGSNWSTTRAGSPVSIPSWPASNIDIVVQSGHNISLTGSPIPIGNITVESGGEIDNNGSTSLRYLTVHGNIEVESGGIFGNGEGVSVQFADGNHTVSGAGNYHFTRLRRDETVNSSGTCILTIDADMELTHGGTNFTNGNDGSGGSGGYFNTIINAGKIVTLSGTGASVVIDGTSTSSANFTNNGGSITVNGTLIIPGTYSTLNSNSTGSHPTSLTINNGGEVRAGFIFNHASAQGTDGHTLTINSGGKLVITNGDGGSPNLPFSNFGVSGTSFVNNGIIEMRVPGNISLNSAITSIGELVVNSTSSTFQLVLQNDLTVGTNLTMTQGRLNLNGHQLTVNGTITGAGAEIMGSAGSDLVIGGSGNVTIPAFESSSRTLNNLTVNRSDVSGRVVTFSSPITVGGTLALTSGFLNMGGNVLTLTGNYTGGSSNSYVRATTGGGMRRTIVPAGSFIFPVGVNPFHPLEVTHGSAGDAEVTVAALPQIRTSDNAGDATSHSVANYWELTSDIALVNPVVTPQWDGTAEQTDFDRVDAHVIYRSGVVGSWISTADVAPSSGADPFTLASGNKGGFTNLAAGTLYQIGVADNFWKLASLPVTWLGVSATKQGTANRINWSTSSELNNAGFEVEKSSNGKSAWRVIGSRAGNGTTMSTSNYELLDLEGGSAYYRIKQRDYSGATDYSKVVAIGAETRTNELAFKIYPNPANGARTNLFITGATIGERLVVSVVNAQGQQVGQWTLNMSTEKNTQTIPVEGLKAGVYYVQMLQDGQMKSQKLIVE